MSEESLTRCVESYPNNKNPVGNKERNQENIMEPLNFIAVYAEPNILAMQDYAFIKRDLFIVTCKGKL